jgi:KUP system potassium uptake protein
MASSDTAAQAGSIATEASADLVEHHDGAGPRGPAVPPPVATLGLGALAVGALGVVYGDIGTSPLYSLQTVFAADHGRIPVNRSAVYGVISMIIWTLLIVVTFKYVALVMRADNDGEGGMMALVALIRRLRDRTGIAGFGLLIVLGVFGASLFFGDAMITPAISVLSAVEGLKIVDPSLGEAVIPIALAVLLVLFAAQRFGTGTVGRLFGPVMIVWFCTIAVAGAVEVARAPGILEAASPTWALSFAVTHTILFLVAITGVVLCITGVEALYGDMGHFGRPAIARAWLWLVFPALLLNYMGQGAHVLAHPAARANPFFLLVPGWAQVPLVLLATVATVIASQSVIAGAFSLGRQAAQLGYLPRLTVRHTSHAEVGQVYLPAINAIVLVAVVLLVLGFRSSANLAAAYGVAVTGTILITTVLFFTVARARWRIPLWMVIAGGVFFGSFDLLFFGVNLTKLAAGGWFPVVVGLGVFTVFMTWNRGRERVTVARERVEGPLRKFVEEVHATRPPLRRVPGTAVFLHAQADSTPWALRPTPSTTTPCTKPS